jgi:hypothetical protein
VIYQTRSVGAQRDTGHTIKEGARTTKEIVTCFDAAVLKPFNAVKQQGNRLAQQYGTKVETLAAWLVPNERVDELMGQLGRLRDKYAQLTEDLAGNIEGLVQTYATLHPDQREQILELGPTPNDVRNATKILYAAYKLRPEDVQDEGCLAADMQQLHVRALHEIHGTLKDSGVNPEGKHFTKNIKEVLNRIAVKARSLAFLHSILDEVATTVEQCLAALPVDGKFDQFHTAAIGSLLSQLMDPWRLLRNGGFTKIEVQPEVEPEPKAEVVEAEPQAEVDAAPATVAADSSEEVVIDVDAEAAALEELFGAGIPGMPEVPDEPQAVPVAW